MTKEHANPATDTEFEADTVVRPPFFAVDTRISAEPQRIAREYEQALAESPPNLVIDKKVAARIERALGTPRK